jgi:hypothetical protein
MVATELTFPGSFDIEAKRASLTDERPRGLVARWLVEHAPPNSSIALYAAGYIPYYTDFFTIDRIGLNSTYIAHNGQRAMGWHPEYKISLDYWLPLRPTFIITRLDYEAFRHGVARPVHPGLYEEDLILLDRSEFLANYVLLEGDHGSTYPVFQLIDTVDPDCLRYLQSVPVPVCEVHGTEYGE